MSWEYLSGRPWKCHESLFVVLEKLFEFYVSMPVLISILSKNHAGPVEKLISDFFRMQKKVGAIDSL